jgi:hypothetical protein
MVMVNLHLSEWENSVEAPCWNEIIGGKFIEFWVLTLLKLIIIFWNLYPLFRQFNIDINWMQHENDSYSYNYG